MNKRLKLSKYNKIITGVCGGIGEYLGADPTLVRVVFAVAAVPTGFAPIIVLYVILWAIMPLDK